MGEGVHRRTWLEDTAPSLLPPSGLFMLLFISMSTGGQETGENLENLLWHINNIFDNPEKRGNCSFKLGTQYSFESIFILIFFIKNNEGVRFLEFSSCPGDCKYFFLTFFYLIFFKSYNHSAGVEDEVSVEGLTQK